MRLFADCNVVCMVADCVCCMVADCVCCIAADQLDVQTVPSKQNLPKKETSEDALRQRGVKYFLCIPLPITNVYHCKLKMHSNPNTKTNQSRI